MSYYNNDPFDKRSSSSKTNRPYGAELGYIDTSTSQQPYRTTSTSISSSSSYPQVKNSAYIEKVDEELAIHIRKAVDPIETAPKQKHVRACQVYTWDTKSAVGFFNGIKAAPIIGEEVMTFKALITIHKVIRGGHPCALAEGIRESLWIENIGKSVGSHGGRGYGALIKAYVQFQMTKLEYHAAHPEFTASFDYEEYVALKGIEDPNDGFQTVDDLIILLDKIDSLQKLIFANFRPGNNNECRIAALVPLVEESYGIYQFLLSMLTAFHQFVGAAEVLAPLRIKFSAGHMALHKFYYECSTLKYLTSLIAVPKLSQDPPDFLATPPTLPAKGKNERVIDFYDEETINLQEQLLQQQVMDQRMADQQLLDQQMMEQQRQFEMQRHLDIQQVHQAQMVPQLQQQLEMFAQRIRQLEAQLSQVSLNNRSQDEAKKELFRKLQVEVEQWKQKYDALAKLYAQLRKEHLELLQRLRTFRENSNKKQHDAVVLQTGLDQSLLALKQLKLTSSDQLSRIMDSVLDSCIAQLDLAVTELNDPVASGNTTATPEYTLSILDKAITSSQHFSSSFVKYLDGGDPYDPVSTSTAFAQSTSQLLSNVKGVLRLAAEDETSDKILVSGKAAATSVKSFFTQVKSFSSNNMDSSSRIDYVNNLARDVDAKFAEIAYIIETLVAKDVQAVVANADNLGDVVEQEMLNVAQAIEQATQKLGALVNRPSGEGLEVKVNALILDAALAMTDAIGSLIRQATVVQQEIVSEGSGGATKSQFYKKNHRWTEGLISAAKAVAFATTYLVECADGVVEGTHSMEQLIVAATEVSAATTQLVAASRVKVAQGSKSHDRLETAAKVVRDATKNLVKAAKEAARNAQKEQAKDEIESWAKSDIKLKEMAAQVKILELEKQLEQARYTLGEVRKSGYHSAESEWNGGSDVGGGDIHDDKE